MELIVAEKPRVAEKIAQALGDNVVKNSYNGVSYYEFVRDGRELVVAPAVGHVYTLVEKEKTRSYPVFDIEWVPAYRASPRVAAYTKDYVELLQKLGRKATTFISACDYDIEGTTISYNIFRYATILREGRRMKFSALTKSDLVEAYENMTDFDYNNAYAGETRHILDWYYGINLSRALMSSMRSASRYMVLSIGRVQGPSLGVLSALERDIRAFVPTPYWELTFEAKNIEFKHVEDRFLEEPKADAALARTKAPATASSVDKKEQVLQPLPCFDLTSLQLEAYRIFKYSPSRVLELAQTLYEASVITYPRTSSQKIPASINVKKILSDLGRTEAYAKLVGKITSEGWTQPVQGKKEDPAHPAIHPTGSPAGKFGEPEKNLYDLIVRRFLAAFAPQATRERVRVEIDASGEHYAASGSRIVEKGWTEFYGPYYTSEDVELPQFTMGEGVAIDNKKKTKKETKPPKRYTPASLVSELEDRHLGTKATRAVIIDTLMKRGYAKTSPSIEVSDFGLKVCDILKKYAPEILDEQLTRRIEDEMEDIQAGKRDKDQVVAEGREILAQILDKWKTNEAKIGAELMDALKTTEHRESLVGVCDKCGKNLRIIRMRDKRQFIGCTGYPNCRNTYPLPTGALVHTSDKPCPVCHKPTVRVKKGKIPFTMCIDPACPSKESWKKREPAHTPASTSTTATAPTTADGDSGSAPTTSASAGPGSLPMAVVRVGSSKSKKSAASATKAKTKTTAVGKTKPKKEKSGKRTSGAAASTTTTAASKRGSAGGRSKSDPDSDAADEAMEATADLE